jgi:hypothetical protein
MALKLQRAFFRFQQRKKLKVVFKSIRRLQMLWRCRFEYLKFKKFCKSLRMLQRWGRKLIFQKNLKLALAKLKKAKKGIIKVQARHRMRVKRKIFLEYRKSARLINACARRFLARMLFYRMRVCRRILMVLKMVR